MKTPLRSFLLAAAFCAVTTIASAANLSGLDVTVKKDGKTVFRAKTDGDGKFATDSLEAGQYNVEFRAAKSNDIKGQLSISVTAGKQPLREASADANHMLGGVVLTVDLAKPTKLTGKVSPSGQTAAAAPANEPGMEKVKANVKVIKGKRYVWVPGALGSNMGGRWVEEGSDAAALSTSNKKGGDGEVLRRVQDQAGNVGSR